MASTQIISRLAFSALTAVTAVSAFSDGLFSLDTTAASCTAADEQLSCHNTTALSTCCINSPGGTLLQVQLWDTDPSTGPDDSWTIHGLWPDLCDGSYNEDCSEDRAYKNISSILKAYGDTALLDYMETYWVSDDESSEDFWQSEWEEHGTCVSTLDPSCFADYKTGEEVPLFFNTTVSLFKKMPTYTWLADAGITPSNSKSYSTSSIQAALTAKHGKSVYLDCYDGVLSEVYYYFNVLGPLQSGTFEATDATASSSCSGDISYPPKSS